MSINIVTEKCNINKKGYGLMPKIVMVDRNLSIPAKAIYAYLVTFAGTTQEAYPSVKKMCYDLGISKEETLRKHLKQLIDFGYVEKRQERKNGGQFKNNIYHLVQEVVVSDEVSSKDNDFELFNSRREQIKTETDDNNTKTHPEFEDEDVNDIKKTTNEFLSYAGDTLKPLPTNRGYGQNGDTAKQGDKSIFSKSNNFILNNNNKQDTVDVDDNKYNYLKRITCVNKEYVLPLDSIKSILREYKGQDDRLVEVVNYVSSHEPPGGYNNIVGMIIACKGWNTSSVEVKSLEKRTYKKNSFHNFESRTNSYTKEELESMAKRKREGYRKRKDDEKNAEELLRRLG